MAPTELAYRRKQRELGEVQVALKLAVDLHKANPHMGDLTQAVRSLIQVKQRMLSEVINMEDQKFGRLTFSKYTVD